MSEHNSIENTNLTYYKRNRDVILNRPKGYYKNDKERLREWTRDKFRNLSEEEKNEKRKYSKNRYQNMSEEKKQKQNKQTKKVIVRHKNLNTIIDKIVC